ncbi:coiled-coil domain-containing protein 30 [Sphaeramia orbicularis]|uniref:coiled-coil domain-containing protein 30 n=1 Tax=Sphaeramia orbicularis TaxID=375764 RepID=UPI00117D9C3F|nr:coiled-coil domain-containing protein 30-like [Sphaeramia orbicularis]
MEQREEELEQISAWFSKEGLVPDVPTEAQLCFLWRTLQHTKSRLNSVTRALDNQRSQHMAEMAEVRKSLEQIRMFTEHKDVLAQEIQDENDQLKDQLRHLVSLQDAQISEVAKMLYQQGLTELIHSSPSEQVAYLLVERASLLETWDNPDKPTADGHTTSLMGMEKQAVNTNAGQSSHKGALRHSQNPWKRLFGLHKASQSKNAFIPAEARCLSGQASNVQRECSRLERDLEEGSRRLAMAHTEIRRLTDELESAHLTQRTYEPELQAAQQEVEQLRQEVEKLKKYEMVELRKAKELNDRLDVEIRALRSRVRSLDAEKSSLQQKVKELESAMQKHHPKVQVQPDPDTDKAVSLQKEVELLESVLLEQQQQAEQQLLAVQIKADKATELAKSKAAELIQNNEANRDLQNKFSTQTKCLLDKESEILSLKQQLDTSQNDLDKLVATVCTRENNSQGPVLWRHQQADSQDYENTHRQQEDSFVTDEKNLQDYQDTVRNLLSTQDECEALKKEICETLKCLDQERSKYHEMKEKRKVKLCRARQKFDEETAWRDEKIKNLERELSLSSHSLIKEKELTLNITLENEKLLVERRRLLQQLNEEEHNKKDSNLTASMSKCRVDFLETENKKLGNKILHMSKQMAVLERTLHSMQSLHFTEELKKISDPQQIFTSLPPKSVPFPENTTSLGVVNITQSSQADATSSPQCSTSSPVSRSAEMGYLNLTSAQSRSDHSTPLRVLSSSDSTYF